MHEEYLYTLKEDLLKELERASKKELTSQTLDNIDKLSHAIKNICKIIDASEESEYSGADGAYEGESYRGSYRGMSRRGGSYRDGGSSYRRRRDSMGRYSREGGYSRSDEMISELREMMESAPDDRTREEFQRMISKMEQM